MFLKITTLQRSTHIILVLVEHFNVHIATILYGKYIILYNTYNIIYQIISYTLCSNKLKFKIKDIKNEKY